MTGKERLSRDLMAMRVASCNALRGKLYEKSRERLAKICPPPRRMPLRREPARALPVPFCRYIFLVDPETSARDLVAAEPCR